MGFPINFQWFYTTYFVSGVAHRLDVSSRRRRTRIADRLGQSCLIYPSITFVIVFFGLKTIADTSINAFSYELFINVRHLRFESVGVLTIKIFRKILLDFKRIIH